MLAAFAEGPVWLGNADLVQRTELPAPTVARLAKTLAGMGLLHYSPARRRYRLDAGVLALGGGIGREARLVEMARPQLQELADRHHVHVSLVALDGTDGLHLAVCHSASTLMTLRLEVGSRIPIAGTATGHAILASLSPAERDELLDRLRARHSRAWPALAARIRDSLDEIARLGFTRSIGSWHEDINGVAVPLRLGAHGRPLSIACGAPSRHLPPEKLEAVGAELVPLAARLSNPG